MPFLSPAKLLVILVVALMVLGPDKLPKVAKQIGDLWGDFRRFREKLESEVRETFPDLPSTETINQAARAPLSFFDTWTETRSQENGTTSAAASSNSSGATGGGVQPSSAPNQPVSAVQVVEETPSDTSIRTTGPGASLHHVRASSDVVPDGPRMD